MRDPYAVLSLKEGEIARLRREINALRLAIELLDDASEGREAPAAGLGELPSALFPASAS